MIRKILKFKNICYSAFLIILFNVLFLNYLFSGDWTQNTDTALASGYYTFDTVTINCTVTCLGNTSLNTGVVITCYNLIISQNSKLSADTQGYLPGQGYGTPTNSAYGGGYGGRGAGGGEFYPGYGSITAPTLLGSGGGIGSGGNGGGAITIIATNEVRIDTGAVISADGETAGGPGGSGGSVYVRTKILSGAGEITAFGGNSGNYWGGGNGGGGRIAIYYETMTFNIENISARRGTPAHGIPPEASCGTIFLKQSNQANGVLVIDGDSYPNGDINKGNYALIRGNYTFDTIVLKNLGSCQIETGSFVNVTDIVSDSYVNIFRVDGDLNKNGDITIPSKLVIEMNSPQKLNNLTIKAGGKLSHSGHYSEVQQLNKINVEVYNNLTIDSGGTIDVTAKGYPTVGGPGKPKSGVVGGSYGGKGGANVGAIAGDTYGSETAPTELGSGGPYNLGAGGGAIYLLVWGTLTNNGSILAGGYNSYISWGTTSGSGGSVFIKTPTLAGSSSGVISARGGDCGGDAGGGGGRIAVYYDTNNYLGSYVDSGGISAFIPSQPGETGTLYLKKATFHLPPETPAIDNPSYSGPIPGKRPAFKWTAPRDEESNNLHFEIEVTQDSSFVSTPTVKAVSSDSVTGFQYSVDNGINWTAFFSSGVASNSNPAIKVSYTVQQDLSIGYWYWRVRAKDIDGYSNWSEKGYLPSIVGDLVVQINSPSDSTAVYDEKIKIEGIMEYSVSRSKTINGVPQELTLSDNNFSFEVGLVIGENTVVVTGNGPIGNYISDTVTIYRLKVPSVTGEGKIESSGGTLRLDDYDGIPENDARIEIGQGVFDKEVKIKMEKIENMEYPIYDISIDNKEHYKLKKKVKLFLSYKNMKVAEIDENKLKVFNWDGAKWRVIGGEVDKTNKLVTCWTDHFSRYAVMIQPEEKDIAVNVSPFMFTPNNDGINDIVIFNIVSRSEGKVEIRIFNETGKIVKIIIDDINAGGMSISWDGLDSNNKLLETGLYVYSVVVSGRIVSSGTLVIAK